MTDFQKEPGHSRLSFFPCAAIFLMALFAGGSALWLFGFLREFPDPSGANGYFYLKQTESLAAGLGYYFKDRSLAFLLPALVMKFCGDALLSFQISIAVVWASLVLGTGFLIWNLTLRLEPRWRLMVLAVSLGALICTTPLYELTLTFFKNAFAVSLAVFALACLTAPRPGKVAWGGTALFTLLALLSHKSMLLIVLCFALPWLAVRATWKQAALVAAGFAGTIGLFVWHFENGREYLRAILHSLIAPGPWWSWFSTLHWINMEMFVSMIGVFSIAIVALIVRRKASPLQKTFIDGSCLFIAIALQPFQLPGAEGPSYRMILLTPLFAIPMLALAMTCLTKKSSAVLLLSILFLGQPFINSKHLDDVFTPWALLRDDVLRIKEFVKPEDHLTSHHGMEFFIDEATGIRSRSFLSDHPEKKNFRIAFIAGRWLRNQEAQNMFREKALLEIGSEYVLVLESDWQELSQRFHLPRHWKNPETHRPAFIYE